MGRPSHRAAALAALLAVGAAGVGGCGAGGRGTPVVSECPARPAPVPTGHEHALSITPTTAAHGETFTARFRERRSRSAELSMTSSNADRCGHVFSILGTKSLELDEGVNLYAFEDTTRQRTVVTGVVPWAAEAGVYRICGDGDTATVTD